MDIAADKIDGALPEIGAWNCPFNLAPPGLDAAPILAQAAAENPPEEIADAILDAYLSRDLASRVAIECFGSHGALMIGGEVSSTAEVDPAQIALRVYREIGYQDDLEVFTNIEEQSPDIGRGVDTGGAGDQDAADARVRRRHADHQAGGGNDAVVGAQDTGAKRMFTVA